MKDKHKSPDVRRVHCGGSWGSDARLCRCACRYWYPSGNRCDHLGFRIVFKKGKRK